MVWMNASFGVVLELAEGLAQEAERADLVVGVAGLDVADLRVLGVEHRDRGVEVAGLRGAVAAGREAVGGREVDDRQLRHRLLERGVVAVV